MARCFFLILFLPMASPWIHFCHANGPYLSKPRSLKYIDLYDYVWLFEKKSRLCDGIRIKNTIMELAFARGVLAKSERFVNDWPEGSNLYNSSAFHDFVKNVSVGDFIKILKKPEFLKEHQKIINQIRFMEMSLADHIESWTLTLRHVPPWFEGVQSLKDFYEKNPRLESLIGHFLDISDAEGRLHVIHSADDTLEFKNSYNGPSKTPEKYMAPLYWPAGLTIRFLPEYARNGAIHPESPDALQRMRTAFAKALTRQTVPMKEQFIFYSIFDEIAQDPWRLIDPDFTMELMGEVGVENFELFFEFFNGYATEDSRNASEYISQWLASPSPGHDLHQTLTAEKEGASTAIVPKQNRTWLSTVHQKLATLTHRCASLLMRNK